MKLGFCHKNQACWCWRLRQISPSSAHSSTIYTVLKEFFIVDPCKYAKSSDKLVRRTNGIINFSVAKILLLHLIFHGGGTCHSVTHATSFISHKACKTLKLFGDFAMMMMWVLVFRCVWLWCIELVCAPSIICVSRNANGDDSLD